MTELNCMFQYGTKHRMLADTDLITQEDALSLFNKNKDDFIKRMDDDEEPQMCVWTNCKAAGNYGDTLNNWYADDFKVIDGELYQKV